MHHFFIVTHLGVDVRFWNELLSKNKYLHSKFIYNEPNIYYNSNIKFENGKNKRTFERYFDILVFNWQIGFKNTLDFSKIVHIWQDDYVSIKNIKNSEIIHPMCAADYLENRKIFIKQLLQRNKNQIHIKDGIENITTKIEKICDFSGVPVCMEDISPVTYHRNYNPLWNF